MLPATRRDLEAIKKACLRMSNRKALLSAAAAVIPIPFTDVATDVVLLGTIIPRITERFGLAKEQIDTYDPQVIILIYDAAKKLGINLIGRYLTKELVLQVLKGVGMRRLTTKQVARYVPLVGQALAAGLSYGAMTLIIRSHVNQCYKVALMAMRKE